MKLLLVSPSGEDWKEAAIRGRELIEKQGYVRRPEELADAEAAAEHWR